MEPTATNTVQIQRVAIPGEVPQTRRGRKKDNIAPVPSVEETIGGAGFLSKRARDSALGEPYKSAGKPTPVAQGQKRLAADLAKRAKHLLK